MYYYYIIEVIVTRVTEFIVVIIRFKWINYSYIQIYYYCTEVIVGSDSNTCYCVYSTYNAI